MVGLNDIYVIKVSRLFAGCPEGYGDSVISTGLAPVLVGPAGR